MNEPRSLKRTMLINPNTGRRGGHPRPGKSTDHSSSKSPSQHPPDQASRQIKSTTATPAPTRPHAESDISTSTPKKTSQKPTKPTTPAIVPPKPTKHHQPTHLARDVSSTLVNQITEAPKLVLTSKEELEQIKNLHSYRPIIIGTTLFILGLFASAILAIVFNLI